MNERNLLSQPMTRPATDYAASPLVRTAQRLLGLLVLVGVLLTTAPSALGAAGSSAPSAADQYVEDIPSTTGNKPAKAPKSGKGSRDDDRGGGSGGSGGSSGSGSSGSGGSGSSGSGGSGSGGSGTAVSPLARRALDELGGPTARELERIATSESLGAPPRRPVRPPPRAEEPSFAGALVSAVSGSAGTTGVLVWVLIAVVATTIAGLVSAGYERRQHRRASV